MEKPEPPADAYPGGQVHPIVLHPHPILHDIAQPAGYLDSETLSQLVGDLLATMYHAEGRGLAAPQIGIARRVFVMDAGWKTGPRAPKVFVDPEILSRSVECEDMTEACLSIPDRSIDVNRPRRIEMSCYDLQGKQKSMILDGIEARIAQHEFDHLNGRLIVDIDQ